MTLARPIGMTSAERTLTPMDAAMVAYIYATPQMRRAMVREARSRYAAHRAPYGFTATATPVLTPPGAQPKLRKSYAPTYGLTLVPADTMPGRNLCPAASDGCRAACLFTSGKGRMTRVQAARLARAMFAMLNPAAFGVLLAHETMVALARHGSIRVRLNVVSDIRWELVIPRAIRALSDRGARFYDYTKWSPHARRFASGLIHLTYSASERMTDSDIRALVDAGHNVAVVFAGSKHDVAAVVASGATWNGLPMVDGLATDDRTLDPRGVIVALAALGDGIHDESGFVRPMPTAHTTGVAA